ncbi:hypothetical protein A9G30_04520 [Gilliamella sp. Fer4-1]|nr:hypothetical protein A9G30_04520 [Gilliamella apicola]
MRRLRFYIIIFLFIFWLLVLLSYFVVQTSFGAKVVSQQLSRLSSYTISIGNVHHSFSNFYELAFDEVVVSDNKQEFIHIPKLVIGLDKSNLWQLSHFNYITIINGAVADTHFGHYTFSSNMLKFVNSNVDVLANNGKDKLSFNKINGGIQPFISSGAGQYQFDFSSQDVLVNQIPIKSLLIQGFHRDGVTTITNLGGNIHNGFFVSKLKVLADNSLNIDQLKLHNINFQSTDDVFWSNYSHILPKLTIKQLSILESSIQLPHFLIEKGNIEATNLCYDDKWRFEQSSFTFNADNVVLHEQSFSSVLVQLSSDNQAVTIQKALAKWNKGSINFSGKWKDNDLQLEKLTLADINYDVPEKFELPVLPDIFKHIIVDKLDILQSLIIRKYSDFPFSLYNFQASGSNVVLAENQKLGIFSGTVFFKSEKGSFNKIDIRYPDLVLKFDSQHHALLTFGSLVDSGMIESQVDIDLLQNEPLSLKFNAYNITSSLLEDWKLVKQPPTAINYSANLHGQFRPFSFAGVFSTNEGNDYIINLEH